MNSVQLIGRLTKDLDLRNTRVAKSSAGKPPYTRWTHLQKIYRIALKGLKVQSKLDKALADIIGNGGSEMKQKERMGIYIGKTYHLTGCGGGKAVFVVERFVGKMPFGNAYWITGEPSFIENVGFPKNRLKYPSLEEIKLFDDLKKRVMAEEEAK